MPLAFAIQVAFEFVLVVETRCGLAPITRGGGILLPVILLPVVNVLGDLLGWYGPLRRQKHANVTGQGLELIEDPSASCLVLRSNSMDVLEQPLVEFFQRIPQVLDERLLSRGRLAETFTHFLNVLKQLLLCHSNPR